MIIMIIMIIMVMIIMLRVGMIIIIITRQILGRPVCDRGAIPRTFGPIERGEKQTNNID